MNTTIGSRDPLGRAGMLLCIAALAALSIITIARSAWPSTLRSMRPSLDTDGPARLGLGRGAHTPAAASYWNENDCLSEEDP